jgi:hypothetical protein
MYKVKWKDAMGDGCVEDCQSLDLALVFAKDLGIPVVIDGGGMEIVGVFGVDSIKDGVCPDGVKYDWNKANRIGRSKRR